MQNSTTSATPKATIWQTLPRHFTALAPMEGVTDVVFRQVVAHAARPDLFFTEFTNVSSYASERGRHDALERLSIAGESALLNCHLAEPELDHPIIAQIWGKNPEHFATTAAILEERGFQGLDLNMGCPDRHVNKAGGGAAMIKTPDLAIECIHQAQAATNLPVSVKTRLGFTYLEEFRDWLPLLLRQNLAALTVHLRTRKEMSKVPAHYELIPEILQLRAELAPQTKLIINGDIPDRAAAERLWEQYPDVDGVMIGRGVFANPWCFAKNPSPATIHQNFDLFRFHLDLHDYRAKELALQGSRYPYEPLKYFIKVYVNNFDGSRDLRNALMQCKSTAELRTVLARA